MITDADKDTGDLPSLAELRALADSAKDNETKAQALCLAAGVANRMGMSKIAVKLSERSSVVVLCDGVSAQTRSQVLDCHKRLLEELMVKAGAKFVRKPLPIREKAKSPVKDGVDAALIAAAKSIASRGGKPSFAAVPGATFDHGKVEIHDEEAYYSWRASVLDAARGGAE